jgi:hypothetical protein
MPGRGGDGTIMRFAVTETLVNIAHIQKFCIGVNYRRRRNALRVLDIGSIGGGRCRIIISISRTVIDRLVDPSGSELKNDDAAIAKAQEFHPAPQVRLS